MMRNVFAGPSLIYPIVCVMIMMNLCIIYQLSAIRRTKNAGKNDIFRDTLSTSNVSASVSGESSFLKEEKFLTLFTTFTTDKEKFYIYNNTLHGWMLLKPKVNLVLFSDDEMLKAYVKNIGWDFTLNVGLTACNGTPVLKDMFLTIQKYFNSKFYAYANADILFDQGLFKTLEGIVKTDGLLQNPILLSGKRFDLILDDFNITHLKGEKQIRNAFRKSKVYYGYAEDYFVVTKKFPWAIYPNLVVGRPMVDNYLTYISRKNKVNVIDTSATIGALHQMTAGRKGAKTKCNKDILGKHWAYWKIAKGNVECFPMETRFDFDGSVLVMSRSLFTTEC